MKKLLIALAAVTALSACGLMAPKIHRQTRQPALCQ